MSFGSRIIDTKDYSSSALRDSYNSNSIMKSSASSQRLQQIRKKYDTPTRKQIKQGYSNSKNLDKANPLFQELQLRKSINSTTTAELSNNDKWGNSQTRSKDLQNCSSSLYSKQNIKGEEQVVFRKIKQMKDSLLTKNYNEKVKTTKSIYEPKISERHQIQSSMLGQCRVENIDKINSKIQQILNCLRQTQTKSSVLMQKQVKRQNNVNLTPNCQVKAYSRIKASEQKLLSKQTASQIRNAKSTYQTNRIQQGTSALHPINKFQIKSKPTTQIPKTKSFIGTMQQQEKQKEGKYQMKNGKKLDDQISKIQQKIQQFQQEKKKLNIQFKPYSFSQSKSSTNLKRNYTVNKYQKYTNRKQIIQSTNKQEQSQSANKTDYKFYQRVSFDPTIQKSLKIGERTKQSIIKNIQTCEINVGDTRAIKKPQAITQQSLFKIKLIPVEHQRQNNSISSNFQDKKLNQQFRRKADEGIQQRKKRICNGTLLKQRPTINKIVEKLKQQADLDQKFRNNKLWFESNIDTAKWSKLSKCLVSKKINLSQQKMKTIFHVTDQQNNPFFSVRQCQANIEQLVQSFSASQQHWKTQISKKFIKADLIREEFTVEVLDLQKKGYIVLQDLVRFLNMETGTFYRNRDIYLILRRISEQQKITFAGLLDSFCH